MSKAKFKVGDRVRCPGINRLGTITSLDSGGYWIKWSDGGGNWEHESNLESFESPNDIVLQAPHFRTIPPEVFPALVLQTIQEIVQNAVAQEKARAIRNHGDFKNIHEAYGCLKEEWGELGKALKKIGGMVCEGSLKDPLGPVLAKKGALTEYMKCYCVNNMLASLDNLIEEAIQVRAVFMKVQDLAEREEGEATR